MTISTRPPALDRLTTNIGAEVTGLHLAASITRQGRLDAAFIGNGAAGLETAINSDPELRANRARFVTLPKPLAKDPLHLAFSKSMDKSAAVARFDAAIDKMRKSGELAQLLRAPQ